MYELIRSRVLGFIRIMRPATGLSTLLTSISASLMLGDPFRYIDPLKLSLLYIGVFLAHMSVNIFNDYFDYRSGIDLYTPRTSFSGGSKSLVDGLLSVSEALCLGIAILLVSALIGIYLALTRGFLVILFILFGGIIIIGYTILFARKGLGELSVYIKGVFVALGSYYVVYQRLDPEAIIIGSLYGLASVTALFVNSIPDRDIDKLFGRRNLVILVNERDLWRIYLILAASIILHVFLISLRIQLSLSAELFYSVACISAILLMILVSSRLREIMSLERSYGERLRELVKIASVNIFSLRLIEFSTAYVLWMRSIKII